MFAKLDGDDAGLLLPHYTETDAVNVARERTVRCLAFNEQGKQNGTCTWETGL